MNTKTILIVVIAMVLSFGAAFVYFNNFAHPNKTPEVTYYNYSPGGEFITNLKGDGKFIKVVVELQVTDPKVLKKLEENTPQIRDAIIQILRSKTAQEVEGPQGQEMLKNDIKNEINKIIGEGKVVNVYFNDFIVQ
ncbi:flagellar FliL protein [Caldanaerobacter subterraneus subsp. tengcongensis MB4]|uniref:Flagellar protein FliL n=4 Tax=Caldanaerobacter subterraneus TaxID=911092 RepID=Q8R9Z9_CALS4|nr:flagellar basal body-associated protein FliL [Caldanaerobacter subterraneus]AAM24653.1 Flagellar basal body-associated protein [Caldanaerobacter subterraneus subsp. tengcongensis MB4]ERM92297.1 flagellar basal body protein FliL [Caldanaerobacter subterraneus subsp. yonseiensis KB-1]KKC29632.1 flagellar basal body-associated protein [Caldanaerobacter subterraneus subsp. pacificus DSM 12653]MBE3579245.1 flagellar basal body-associated FliL family protein [Caldanaerobacter subterraneus]MCS3915